MTEFPPAGAGFGSDTSRTGTVKELPKSVATVSSLRAQAGYDPTGTTASDTQLQAALNGALAFAEPVVTVPHGDICKLSTGEITIPSGVELRVHGTIDASSCPANGNVLKSLGSTTGSALSLAADCPAGQPYLQVSGTAPADGTICLLYSNAMWVSAFTSNASASGNQQLGEYVTARQPTSTLNTSIGTGDTTIILNNLGDIFRSLFWPGAPILIGSEQITFTSVSITATTITLNSCTRAANGTTAASHTSGAAVALPPGWVAFESGVNARPGGSYAVADSAALQPCSFNEGVKVTGTGKIVGSGAFGGQVGIMFDRCRRINLSHTLRLENFGSFSIQMWDVLESSVEGPQTYIPASNPPAGNNHGSQGYGIAFFCACQDVTIHGGAFHGGKHGITGGNTFTRPGIIRRVKSVGANFVNQTVAGFDMHSGAEQVTVEEFTAVGIGGNAAIQLRCPSARVHGQVKQSVAGVLGVNQTDIATDYDIDVDCQDVSAFGVEFQPNTNFNTKLTGSLTNSFTGYVPVSSGTTGFAASGYLMLEDTIDATTGLGEIVHYTSLDSGGFNVDARGALGTPAIAHSAGATIEQANTGIGAKTNKLRIRCSVDRLTAGPSVVIQTYDNYRITGFDLDLTVRDPVYAHPRALIQGCDLAFIKARMGNWPANEKAVQLIGCKNSVVDAIVDYSSQGTGIAVSLESASSGMIVRNPIAPTAGTGVAADSTCTNCMVTTVQGLIGATTPTSLPSGKGHIVGGIANYSKTTSSDTFVVPTGVTTMRIRAIAGGGGGGGAGSAAATQLQAGGGGGAGGTIVDVEVAVSPGETLTRTVGAGGASGNSGAAGGNAGGNGGTGGTTSVSGSVSGSLITALGGRGGGASAASSTTVGQGGGYGSSFLVNSNTGPGQGGQGGSASSYPMVCVVGGAGGGPATTTNGGGGGTAQVTSSALAQQSAGGSGSSGTSAGVNGTTATYPGCGGGGGGGGAAGTGAGGAGGVGGGGQIEMWW